MPSADVDTLRRGYEALNRGDLSGVRALLHPDIEWEEGPGTGRVSGVEVEARIAPRPGGRLSVWHDRAVFHFLVDEEDRASYREVLRRSLAPNGHAVIATFGPDGPTTCSGLPGARYDAQALAETLAPVAELVSNHLETHETPSGSAQQFLYAHLRARPEDGSDLATTLT